MYQSGMRRCSDVSFLSHLSWDVTDNNEMLSRNVNFWDGSFWDVVTTSHWYLNKTDQFDTSLRRTNCYLNGIDEPETSQLIPKWNWWTWGVIITYWLVREWEWPLSDVVKAHRLMPRRNATYLRCQRNASVST